VSQRPATLEAVRAGYYGRRSTVLAQAGPVGRAAIRRPHPILALAAGSLLFAEWKRVDRSLAWPLLSAAIAGAALLLAWRERDRLRLMPILAIGAALQLAWVAIHVRTGFFGDLDARIVYTKAGRSLLHGAYPRSAYPAGAVALFGLEVLLGRGSARIANGLLMVPFQLACIAALWSLRTRWCKWIAACLALWPLDLFFWEFRFDLVPAAALLAGLALAYSERWHVAGWALGIGAAAKWTPGLAAVGLCLWLLRSRRGHAAAAHAAGFALPILLAYVPLLLLSPSEALDPYRAQPVRAIDGESLPYLLLRAIGLAHPSRHYYADALAPGWSSAGAVVLQLGAVAALAAGTARARSARQAIGLAALLPVAFLLTNRIFSPQFMVVIVAGVAFSAALADHGPRRLLLALGALAAGTVGNTTLFPFLAGPVAEHPGWTFASAAALLLPVAAAVVLATSRPSRDEPIAGAAQQGA
jgi:hypothetical protein